LHKTASYIRIADAASVNETRLLMKTAAIRRDATSTRVCLGISGA
jgi:hypothetical protein